MNASILPHEHRGARVGCVQRCFVRALGIEPASSAKERKAGSGAFHSVQGCFVRDTRIELVSTAWEAVVLPLN